MSVAHAVRSAHIALAPYMSLAPPREGEYVSTWEPSVTCDVRDPDENWIDNLKQGATKR